MSASASIAKPGPKERRFLDAIRDLFIGVKVAGQSGYINLMRIKAAYFQKVVEPALMEDIAKALKDFPEFREELFDKLHTFFSRYFSRSGSICFPYYDPKQNRIARFIPDFIFWGREKDKYTILFVDPKGMEQIDWERKIDGYCRLFGDEKRNPRSFDHQGVQVSVRLHLFTRDRNDCPEGSYKRFWMDAIPMLFKGAFGLA